MRRRVGHDGDRGATMLLVTISMVMLLLFGAFAVDLGGAWSQRRENQGAIDPAGIGGALETRSKSQAQAIADADTEIIRLTYNSIAPAMTLAQWQADWAACTDPDKGAEYTITGSSDCISYTSNLQKIRAKTPLVDTETTFAAIIGLDTLQTDAFVEVIVGLQDRGSILPFGIPASNAGSTELCLKTAQAPAAIPPCEGPTTGNFGALSIAEYGNDLLGTTKTCGGGLGLFARNIAHGADHPIVTAEPGAPVRSDFEGCSPQTNFNFEPYTLTTEGGNKEPAVFDGLIGGTGGFPGRLTNAPEVVVTAKGTFDDKPLWDYLNAAGVAACGGSRPSNQAEMIACLDAMSGNTAYFVEDLRFSGRFAWVPLFYGELTNGPPSTAMNIQEFRPVYVQSTIWGCDNAPCVVHNPGEPIAGAILGTDKLDALTALQIPRSNLPDTIDDGLFGDGSQTFYAIVE